MRNSYDQGRFAALVKLGFFPTLANAAVGGAAGYLLSPDDRRIQGMASGAALAGLGNYAGRKLSPLLHDARSAKLPAAVKGIPAIGGALGTMGGIGLSQALQSKDAPDLSENPYHYPYR